MRRAILGMMLAWSSVAHAERTMSYEEALRLAVERNPTLRTAVQTAEQAGYDVTAANGQFDPVLNVDAGWNRSTNRQRFGQFPDPFNIDSDGWNVGVNLAASAPSGTSAVFDARLVESTATITLDGADGSVLDAIFGDDQVQKTFQPRFSLSLSQELLKGVLTRFNLQNVRRTQFARSLAELDVERARQQALADVSQSYWNWVYLDRLAEISRQSVAVAEENLRVGGAKVDAGQAAPMERTRLEAALVQSRSAAIEAENNAAGARDALLLLVGEAPGALVRPTTDPGVVPDLDLDATRAVEVAMAQSIDLAVQRQRVEDAERQLRDARHAVMPSLTANVTGSLSGFDDTSWAGAFSLNETLFPAVNIGGQLSVPLGSRASVGASRRAAEEVEKQKALLRDLEGQVRANVERQVRVLRSASQKVELADVNVRLARETLAAEQSLYDVGRALLKDVLESRTQLEQAESEAIRARTDYRVAEVELRRLQGQLVR